MTGEQELFFHTNPSIFRRPQQSLRLSLQINTLTYFHGRVHSCQSYLNLKKASSLDSPPLPTDALIFLWTIWEYRNEGKMLRSEIHHGGLKFLGLRRQRKLRLKNEFAFFQSSSPSLQLPYLPKVSELSRS